MAFRLGMDAVLSIQTDGVAGIAGYNVVDQTRDLTLNLERAEADLTHRGNNGFRATVATIADASTEFSMVWDTADARFTEIKDAFFNNTVLGVRVLDQPFATPGAQGLEADMMVTAFTRNEQLEEGITVDVTFKITHSATPPVWITTI